MAHFSKYIPTLLKWEGGWSDNKKDNEEWRPVVGYEGFYEVSSLGRIKSLQRNGTIKADRIITPNKGRYLRVGLRKNGIRVFYSVHRIVCEAFHDNPEHKPCVDHINNNQHDNRAENLRWCTFYENMHNPISFEKKLKVARMRRGTNGHPVEMLSLNGCVIKRFSCIREAERETGIYHTNISRAIKQEPYGKEQKVMRSAGGYKWRFC